MERIDPDAVELPSWYRPNPGRAGDLAFILFTGEGERTRANRISNGRWALSAFGTASSAALDRRRHRLRGHADLSPVGPADEPRRRDRRRRPDRDRARLRPGDVLGGGAPLRGHGRLLHLDDAARDRRRAAEHPAERHHPVRLFIGSGMPRGLWRRVSEPLRPRAGARVLRLDRGRGDPRQPRPATSPAARAGRFRAAPRSGSPPTTSRPGGCSSARTASRSPARSGEVGMLLTASARTWSRPATARCAASSSPTTPGSRPATSSAATSTATSGSSTASRR